MKLLVPSLAFSPSLTIGSRLISPSRPLTSPRTSPRSTPRLHSSRRHVLSMATEPPKAPKPDDTLEERLSRIAREDPGTFSEKLAKVNAEGDKYAEEMLSKLDPDQLAYLEFVTVFVVASAGIVGAASLLRLLKFLDFF